MSYQRWTLAELRRDGRPALSMLTYTPASLAISLIFATVSHFRFSGRFVLILRPGDDLPALYPPKPVPSPAS